MVETVRGQVGLANPGDLAGEHAVRIDSMGAIITNPLGKWYNIAKKGVLFSAATSGAGTALTVDIEGTAASVVLHNPSGSGKDCVLLECRVARGTTGDVGPGSIQLAVENDSTLTVPSGTALTVQNALGSGGGSSIARVFEASTVDGTDPVRTRIVATLGENLLATTAVAVQGPAVDAIDGAIILTPGDYAIIAGEGNAGASPLVHVSLLWAEVPV